MLCPMRRITAPDEMQRSYDGIKQKIEVSKTDFLACLQAECAWWDDIYNECCIKRLPVAVRGVGMAIKVTSEANHDLE